jgi:TrmH family RNA methyltransferase
VRELYVAPASFLGAETHALARDCEARGAVVVEIDDRVLAGLLGSARPDGVLAVVGRPPTALARVELRPDALVVVAAGLERPGNLGTMIRTAAAIGASAFVAADPVTDVYHREVVRGSLGAVFHVPCAAAPTDQALAWLRAGNVRILATTPRGGTTYDEVDYGGAIAIALGSERHGLPATWLDAAHERITIPVAAAVDSLNVAVAAGVVLCAAALARRGDVNTAFGPRRRCTSRR